MDIRCDGFIYWILDETNNLVKIGRTKNDPKIRLGKLQTSTGNKLKIIHIEKTNDMVNLERYYHKKYEKYHVLNEWFKYSKDITYWYDKEEEEIKYYKRIAQLKFEHEKFTKKHEILKKEAEKDLEQSKKELEQSKKELEQSKKEVIDYEKYLIKEYGENYKKIFDNDNLSYNFPNMLIFSIVFFILFFWYIF